MRKFTIFECLDYEINSSWWAKDLDYEWMREFSGRYFAWKVKRKYKRYLFNYTVKQDIKNGQI